MNFWNKSKKPPHRTAEQALHGDETGFLRLGAGSRSSYSAMLYIDLDHFKVSNGIEARAATEGFLWTFRGLGFCCQGF